MNFTRNISTAWTALKRNSASGFRLSPVVDVRRDLCQPCPHRRGSHCEQCGCNIAIKTILDLEQCPIHRWELHDVFDAVYVINLKRRPDRLADFNSRLAKSSWPFRDPIVVEAVDGRSIAKPDWWGRQGSGALGCYLSHVRILRQAIADGHQSILILEDDALCRPDFAARVHEFLTTVPDDWNCLYLGGHHSRRDNVLPKLLSAHVVVPHRIDATHAHAYRGDGMRITLSHLEDYDRQKSQPGKHVDHALGDLHASRRLQVYSPREWLVGQGENVSDIANAWKPTRFWDVKLFDTPLPPQTVVAIVGLHSSGSSCLANCLSAMGVDFGAPDGEHPRLVDLLNRILPTPSIEPVRANGWFENRLRKFIARRRRANRPDRLIGLKFPTLSAFGPQLVNAAGGDIKIIHASRLQRHSVESFVNRWGVEDSARDQLEQHQHWLDHRLANFLKTVPHHRVRFEDMLANPIGELTSVAQWINHDAIRMDASAIEAAAAIVHDRSPEPATTASDAESL